MAPRSLAAFSSIVVLLFGTPLHAQTIKAQILGTVTDSSEAVVAGVSVKIVETQTNSVRAVATNEAGFYIAANLDSGQYEVSVEAPGFQKAVRSGIDLQPNTTVRVNFELMPGQVTEVVTVSGATAPLLQTDRADTGGKIQQLQLQTMPLLFNRNYQSLLFLVPGVGRPFRPHSEFYNSHDSLSVRVNGQGRQFNNFQIEGIENKIDNGNLTALVPPAEAIQTVDISTSNFDPEFGNAGGAVTNVTLRSGTNDFHGSLFSYHRNENIQARQVFALTKAPTLYNQFGGTLGGRIVRDRMFFFGDYQGSRDHLGQTNRATIPGLAFRRGDLSASPSTIYDPLTGDNQGRGRMPFAGNVIPDARISPIAKRIVAFLPPPNIAGVAEGQVNFDQNSVRIKNLDQADAKYDWIISDNRRISARYSIQKAKVIDPGLYGPNGGIYGGPRNTGFAGSGPARTQAAGISYSHIFSPSFIWESRVGLIRNRNDAINVDRGLKTSEEIGIPGVNLDEWSSGLVEIRVDGYSQPVVGFSPSLPWARSVTTFGIVNNFSKTFSTHVMRFGMDIRRERNDLQNTQTFNPRGRFEFAQGQTGDAADSRRSFANAFAAFLLDQPNIAGRDLALLFPARREINYNLYFQDKWQVSRKLTIDLGLRWEFQPAGRPRFPGGYSNYNPENNTLELAGLGAIPIDQGVSNQKTNFAPRLGIAYRINDRTVIRAGYGMSYILRRTGQVTNFPVAQNNAFPADNGFIAARTMVQGFPTPVAVQIPPDGVIRNPDLRSNFTNTPKYLPFPYVQSWNFAIQRALPFNLALDLAYIGNHGVNNQSDFNINAALTPGTGNAGRPLNQRFGRVADTTSFIGTHTNYHGMQIKLDRRFQGGFMLTTAYTWSKAINFAEDNGAVNIPMNLAVNRGRSSDNRTSVFVQSYVWDLPFGAGKRYFRSGAGKWVLGGWQVQGILSLMTGLPFAVTANTASLNAPGNVQRPNAIAPVTYPRLVAGSASRGNKWFDTAAFAAPTQNTLGNAGRNTLIGPGLRNLDFSVFRDFPVPFREGMHLTFRAESFNLTNTPHFQIPEGNFNSGSFGLVTNAEQDPRQLQFALTLRF